jgi:hypothetical protein
MKKSVVIGLWLVFSSVGVLLCTCSSSKTSQPPARCSSITPCETDFICIEGFCRKSCSEEIKCSDGMTCSAQNYCIKPCQKKEDCVDYEQCLDGICELVCIDNDGDGYGNFCARGDDCENNEKDNDPTINPGQGEIADDGIDNNCNGMTDEAEWEQYPICNDETQSGTMIAPNLMLVLDISESMNRSINNDQYPANGEQSRLDILKEKVISFITNNKDLKDVQDRDDSAITTLTNNINALVAANYTPTSQALETVSKHLTDTTRDNYVLLVTDGVPTCPSGNMNGDANDNLLTLNAVKALYNDNNRRIRTFVIGIGETVNTDGKQLLNDCAEAGHTDREGDTKYYPALNADDIAKGLADITNRLSCKITTKKDPVINTGLYVDRLWLVYNDGNNDVAIPRGSTNGFEYIGNYTFEIYGNYCDMLMSGKITNIHIIMGCAPPL